MSTLLQPKRLRGPWRGYAWFPMPVLGRPSSATPQIVSSRVIPYPEELQPAHLHRHSVDDVLARLGDVEDLTILASKGHIGVERTCALRQFDGADELAFRGQHHHFPRVDIRDIQVALLIYGHPIAANPPTGQVGHNA